MRWANITKKIAIANCAVRSTTIQNGSQVEIKWIIDCVFFVSIPKELLSPKHNIVLFLHHSWSSAVCSVELMHIKITVSKTVSLITSTNSKLIGIEASSNLHHVGTSWYLLYLEVLTSHTPSILGWNLDIWFPPHQIERVSGPG